MRIANYINGIEGVAAGGISSINVPVNRRHHAIKLFATGLVSAVAQTDPANLIDYVRVIVNGVVIRDLTPAQIATIAKLNGITPADNELPLFFSEPWRASIIGEESTSWDLAGQTKMTIEVKFKSTVTSPSLTALDLFDFGRNVSNNAPFLAINKQLSFNYNVPSGAFDVTTLPIRFPISRIILTPSAGTISAVEVTRDGAKVLEMTKAQNAAVLKDYGLDSTAAEFPIVFDFEQQVSSPLLVARELNVRVTCSDANTLTALVEHRANGYI